MYGAFYVNAHLLVGHIARYAPSSQTAPLHKIHHPVLNNDY